MTTERKRQAEEAADKYISDKTFTLRGFNSAERGLIYSAYHRAYIQGWTDADTTPMPDAGDEEAANKYCDENFSTQYHDEYWIGKSTFLAGIAHARRTQAAEIDRLRIDNEMRTKQSMERLRAIDELRALLDCSMGYVLGQKDHDPVFAKLLSDYANLKNGNV